MEKTFSRICVGEAKRRNLTVESSSSFVNVILDRKQSSIHRGHLSLFVVVISRSFICSYVSGWRVKTKLVPKQQSVCCAAYCDICAFGIFVVVYRRANDDGLHRLAR
jgi:hypothetical protein